MCRRETSVSYQATNSVEKSRLFGPGRVLTRKDGNNRRFALTFGQDKGFGCFPKHDLADGEGFEPNSASESTENTSDTTGHPGGTESGTLGMQPRCDIPSKSTKSAAPWGKNEVHENGSSDPLETLNGSSDPLETPNDPPDQLETLKRLARRLSPEQRRQLAEWLIRGER